METSLQMDLARRSGVTAIGSPRSVTMNQWVIKGSKSYLVLQTALASPITYRELYITPAGALAVRAAPVADPLSHDTMFGDEDIPNCAVWIRGDGTTAMTITREDNGAPYRISPSGTADTIDCNAVIIPAEERGEGYNAIGPDLSGTTRVWVKSRPGTGAGLILQLNGVPWVIYVDAANALKCQLVT